MDEGVKMRRFLKYANKNNSLVPKDEAVVSLVDEMWYVWTLETSVESIGFIQDLYGQRLLHLKTKFCNLPRLGGGTGFEGERTNHEME